MKRLILASKSRYRRALLERLGLDFGYQSPVVDETAPDLEGVEPEAMAIELARRKALAVAERRPDTVVIGCDQVCALGDEALGKPGSAEAAVEQLTRLAGQEHRLITAVAIVVDGEVREFQDVTRLWMRALDEGEIRRYVERDQPVDCAGSYKLECLGIALFDRIDSEDHSAIVGLPLMQLAKALRALGYPVP